MRLESNRGGKREEGIDSSFSFAKAAKDSGGKDNFSFFLPLFPVHILICAKGPATPDGHTLQFGAFQGWFFVFECIEGGKRREQGVNFHIKQTPSSLFTGDERGGGKRRKICGPEGILAFCFSVLSV